MATKKVPALTDGGKINEKHIPEQLTDTALSAAIVHGASTLSTNGAFATGKFNRDPNVNGWYVVIGIDDTLDMPYARDNGNGRLLLCTGVDDSNRPNVWASKGMPTGVVYGGLQKIVTFKGKLYLYARDDVNGGRASVWSAAPTPGSTPLAWDADPLVTTSTGSVPRSTCFNTDGQYLYIGDYGDPVGGAKLLRSADGVTWQTMVIFPIRHIHGVHPDPYNAGHVWMCGGDGVGNPNMFSTDHGVTWASAGAGSFQITELSFTETDIWGIDDTSFITAGYYERATQTWHGGAGGFAEYVAHPGARAGTGHYYDGAATSGIDVFTSPSAAFVDADIGITLSGQGIPAGTTVKAITNGTTVQLSKNATATVANGAFYVARRAPSFATAVFYGKVDPDTGIMYLQTQEQSPTTPEAGLFAIMAKGAPPVLLDYGKAGIKIGNYEQHIWRGRLFYGAYNRPLLQR